MDGADGKDGWMGAGVSVGMGEEMVENVPRPGLDYQGEL